MPHCLLTRHAILPWILHRLPKFQNRTRPHQQQARLRRRKRPSKPGESPSVHSTDRVATLKNILFGFDGRYTVVDRFDTDGRRYVVAYENPPNVRDPRGLTRPGRVPGDTGEPVHQWSHLTAARVRHLR